MSQGEQWRHHYIPEFYLKRWTSLRGPSEQRKLVEFQRQENGRVTPRWPSPKATGFEDKLYHLKGLQPEQAKLLESQFFAKVDNGASTFLDKIERGDPGFTPKESSAWAQFVLSLALRHPEMVRAVLNNMRDLLRRDLAESARPEWFTEEDPALLKAAKDLFRSGVIDDWMSRSSLNALANSISNEQMGQSLVGKSWGMLRAPINAPALLTSDRPLLWSNPLEHPEFLMLLPIGPKRIFYAVNEGSDLERRIKRPDARRLTDYLNDQVTRRAVRYVYSFCESAIGFVGERMGIDPIPDQADLLLKAVLGQWKPDTTKKGKGPPAR